MSPWEAIIFGVVQGLSEFLPISSTAHIIITEMVLGYHFPGLAFEVYLHLASVLAVVVYFREDLRKMISGFFKFIHRKDPVHRVHFFFILFLLIATAITGVLGIILERLVSDYMKTPGAIAATLTFTGIMIVATERFKTYGHRTDKEMTFIDSVIIGLGQTLSVFPGISRSGTTLITALWLGLDRKTAVRFSFILAIPVILGSSVLTVLKIQHAMWGEIGTFSLIVSFVVTILFSWIGIKWLIDFLNRSKLIYFAAYCFILALGVYILG